MSRKSENRDILNERIDDLKKVIDILTVLRDHPEIGEKRICDEKGMPFTRYRRLAYDTDWFGPTKSVNPEETSMDKMRKSKPTLSWYDNLWCDIMGVDYRDVAVCPSDIEETIEWLLANKLTEREAKVIRNRYEGCMTLMEIGNELGVTGDRIAQIEAKALRKLRGANGWMRFGRNHWIPILKIQKNIESDAEIAIKHHVMASLDDRMPSLRKYIHDGIKMEEKEHAQVHPDLPIADMDLSVRSHNCLSRAGIDTLDDIRHMTESDLMKVRNLGAGCIREIKNKLEEYGFALLPDEEE